MCNFLACGSTLDLIKLAVAVVAGIALAAIPIAACERGERGRHDG